MKKNALLSAACLLSGLFLFFFPEQRKIVAYASDESEIPTCIPKQNSDCKSSATGNIYFHYEFHEIPNPNN